MIHMGRKKKQH